MTNIETTEENIDGLNNAYRNVPYLSAPRLSNITERHPTYDNDNYYDSPTQQEPVHTSLCKETLNYFHDNEIEEDRDSAFDDFYNEFLDNVSKEYLCTVEEIPPNNNLDASQPSLIKMAYAK